MRSAEYLLYRLNFVDREGLFSKPVRTDEEIRLLVRTATTERSDLVQSRPRSGSRWSLRQEQADFLEDLENRQFISVIFSHEATYKEGPIVTARGISRGVSDISPPTATTVHVVFDLKRHVVAIQDVPAIMQAKRGWKTHLELILNSGAIWNNFTSMVSLDPIAPRQIIEKRLSNFIRVTRLRLTLRIPNPDLGPSFQRLYDEMNRGGIRELTEDMRSARGLDLTEDSLPKASLDMALSGYRKGEVRIYGYKSNNERDKVTIADDVARIEIDGLRDLVSGIQVGSTSAEVKRVVRAIIRRIDEMLPSRSVDQ